jgi:signal transduction histidine kinase
LIGETFYLTADRELILFRIVQEALSNIMKHADASEVRIAIDYSKLSQLSMRIQDNGTGFDIHKVQDGSGLLNIKQRALLLKGFCRIESMKGNGTMIFIQIPVHEAQEFELQSIEEKVQADTKISSL